MKIKTALTGLLFAGMITCGAAQATQTVVMSFTARIDGVGSQGGTNSAISDLIPIGSVVTGRFLYDLNAPVTWNYNPLEYQYQGREFSIEVGGFSAISHMPDVTVINGAYMGWDQFVVWADPDNGLVSSGSPLPLFNMGFGLYDSTGTHFQSIALPITDLALNDFNDNYFILGFVKDPLNPNLEYYTVGGRVTSLTLESASVPEPGSIALLGLALGGLSASRRMRLKVS